MLLSTLGESLLEFIECDAMVAIDGDEVLLVEYLTGAEIVQSLVEAGDDSGTLSHDGNLTL